MLFLLCKQGNNARVEGKSLQALTLFFVSNIGVYGQLVTLANPDAFCSQIFHNYERQLKTDPSLTTKIQTWDKQIADN